jgi:hypothetical protein
MKLKKRNFDLLFIHISSNSHHFTYWNISFVYIFIFCCFLCVFTDYINIHVRNYCMLFLHWFNIMEYTFLGLKVVVYTTLKNIFMTYQCQVKSSCVELDSYSINVKNLEVTRSAHNTIFIENFNKKQTLWFQPAKWTIPTERPLLVSKVSAHFSG